MVRTMDLFVDDQRLLVVFQRLALQSLTFQYDPYVAKRDTGSDILGP